MGIRSSQRAFGFSPSRRERRRDRHGRGLRGPLAPPNVPLGRTRAERFEDFVLEAVEMLEARWSAELASVEFEIRDVPPVGPSAPGGSSDDGLAGDEPERVPLGSALPATGHSPPRVVVYRRPTEARASGDSELAALVYEVVVEELANLLGVEPEAIDPSRPGHDE